MDKKHVPIMGTDPYQYIRFLIEGLPPGCMMHNGRLANPMDPISKAMKAIHGKPAKQKTDEDRETLIKLEWYGGLYTNKDGRVVWPGENIEGMFYWTAGRKRMKPAIRQGLQCKEDPLLIYNGPKDIDKLWESGDFLDVRNAKPQAGTVQRARPIFREWKLDFTIGFLPQIMNKDDVIEILTLASIYQGLSDYRPKYGRFNVLDVSPGQKPKEA